MSAGTRSELCGVHRHIARKALFQRTSARNNGGHLGSWCHRRPASRTQNTDLRGGLEALDCRRCEFADRCRTKQSKRSRNSIHRSLHASHVKTATQNAKCDSCTQIAITRIGHAARILRCSARTLRSWKATTGCHATGAAVAIGISTVVRVGT